VNRSSGAGKLRDFKHRLTAAHQQVIYDVSVAFYLNAVRARAATAAQSLKNAQPSKGRRTTATRIQSEPSLVSQVRQATAQAKLAVVQATAAPKIPISI
jgi:hypothetical protein